MSLEKLISRNIDRQTVKSRTARRVALIGTAMCFAVMVLAICTQRGFNHAIAERMSLLLADYRLTEAESWLMEQSSAMVVDEEFIAQAATTKGVEHIYPTLELASILQSDQSNQGVIIRGVDPLMFGTTIEQLITSKSDEVLLDENNVIISQTLARAANLVVGDNVSLVILSDNYPRKKNVKIGAIFSTSVGDIEKPMVFCSLNFAQELAMADSSAIISAYEIHGSINPLAVEDLASQYGLQVASLEERVGELFDWLDVLNGNMVLVLIIMLIVAMINIASSSLIIILESTKKIALLSALGMTQSRLQRIFLRHTMSLVVRGAIYGVSIGLMITAAQDIFGIVKLDPTNYFVEVLPMYIAVVDIVAVLLIAFAFVFFVVWGSTRLVSRTEVASGLKFE